MSYRLLMEVTVRDYPDTTAKSTQLGITFT
jgi:hypothetical protein